LAKKPVNTKKKPDKKTETKSKDEKVPKKNRFRLIVVAVVVICLIGAVLLVVNTDILSSEEETKAQLTFEVGSIVQVKHTGGSWVDAEDKMDLFESDSVKTGDDSTATIVLFKGSIVRLDSNTEITLKKIIDDEETSVTIEQGAGRTWSTIQGISGMDNYEVETPTAVASVRGTSFDVNITEEGITIVSVINGSVEVTKIGTTTTYTVLENYSVTVDSEGVGESQTFDRDDWIENNLLKDEQFKDDLRTTLKAKVLEHLDEIEEIIGEEIPEEHIDILIDQFIKGKPLPPNTPDELLEIIKL